MKKFILLMSVIGLISMSSCGTKTVDNTTKTDSTKVVVKDTIKPIAPVITPIVKK